MNNSIKKGYEDATKNAGAQYGGQVADQYVSRINEAIDKLNDDINRFKGFKTSSDQLQGNVAEYWHGDTFNINAVIDGSSDRANVPGSHGLGSADIEIGDIEYGLKYYKDAIASAKAQSESYFQRFCEYKANGHPNTSFADYLAQNGINEDIPLYDSIYSGQVRIIPSDQYEAAVEYLKWKIAKEATIRPEQVKRYQETLDHLTTKIKHNGMESVELDRETSQKLAQLAKEGKADVREFGISTDKLMSFHHALAKGLEAGRTAGVITMVLKAAPHLYKCIEELISSGQIDEEEFKELGLKALTGYAEGFVRGFVTSTLVTSCESGILGTSLQSMDPGIIGALVVICMQAIQGSYRLSKGEISKEEFIADISRTTFVAVCGVGTGMALAALTMGNTLAYMLGNFVGSLLGSFVYTGIDNVVMAIAVEKGWTFFGIVDQNYELPDSVLKEIGLDIFEFDEFEFDEFEFDEFKFDEFEFDEFKPDFITVLRRGVIGVHKVGYIQD
ncbi:MAG: hypothetical protein IJU79_01135 [Desulfovibrionaceae bacterium]|nr:hypothetical protein [Desulfovibrionaceae bacterium]